MILAAVQQAHRRHQQTLERLHGQKITLGGVTLTAAVFREAVRYQRDDDGVWRPVQTLIATVLKTRLRTAPAKQTVLVNDGDSFQVDQVDGHNQTDIAWVITASRKLPAPT